jgi:hypothetical protein
MCDLNSLEKLENNYIPHAVYKEKEISFRGYITSPVNYKESGLFWYIGSGSGFLLLDENKIIPYSDYLILWN